MQQDKNIEEQIEKTVQDLIKELRSQRYVDNTVDLLNRIDAGEEISISETCMKLNVPEWFVWLSWEIRNADRRVIQSEKDRECELLGGHNAFLEKIKATKH